MPRRWKGVCFVFCACSKRGLTATALIHCMREKYNLRKAENPIGHYDQDFIYMRGCDEIKNKR